MVVKHFTIRLNGLSRELTMFRNRCLCLSVINALYYTQMFNPSSLYKIITPNLSSLTAMSMLTSVSEQIGFQMLFFLFFFRGLQQALIFLLRMKPVVVFLLKISISFLNNASAVATEEKTYSVFSSVV